MNKKLRLGTAALTLLSPFAAFADEPTGPTVWDGFSGFLSPDWSRDFSATVGVKIWINDWQRDSFLLNSIVTDDVLVISRDTAPDNQESDIEPVPIPQISARYKWLFVTGSYYAKTGFDFDDSEATVTVVTPNTIDPDQVTNFAETTTVFSTSGDRYEWDASGGVYIHPYVAILGGYKKVRQEIDFFATRTTEQILPPQLVPPDSSRSFSDIDIEGPTIGIAASVPIGRGFGVYASYAHGFMDAELRDVLRIPVDQEIASGEFDATYDVAELGFSYTHGTQNLAPHMPLSAATVYAGYRYQNISTEFDEPNQDRADVTKGFAVGVNLTF
ncbi:MAG: hypothetical protein ACT4QB_05210 [Gammaproteobacteria bacterium]